MTTKSILFKRLKVILALDVTPILKDENAVLFGQFLDPREKGELASKAAGWFGALAWLLFCSFQSEL